MSQFMRRPEALTASRAAVCVQGNERSLRREGHGVNLERLPGWIADQVQPVLEAALSRDGLQATLEIGGAERAKRSRPTTRTCWRTRS